MPVRIWPRAQNYLLVFENTYCYIGGMRQYLEVLKDVLEKGHDVSDRTGVGTRFLWGKMMRFDMNDGFPAMTTKKLAFRSVLAELLWFLMGSRDSRELNRIGSRIWDANAHSPYWKDRAQFEGDAGRIYGVQWRQWQKSDGSQVDQLEYIIEGIKNNPGSRKLVMSAWNAGEINEMSLEPCHVASHFYVDTHSGTLCLAMLQRSADMFLGVPFNIASYALLLHIVSAMTGYKPGEYVHFMTHTHIYKNHFEQIKEQLLRQPYPLPSIWLTPEFGKMKSVDDLNEFLNQLRNKFDRLDSEMGEREKSAKSDEEKKQIQRERNSRIDEIHETIARLENYQCHPAIKAEMAV